MNAKTAAFFLFGFSFISAQKVPVFPDDVAAKLAEKPLKCIPQEYPNKTAHIINNGSEATLTPRQLHPAFYGCFDWHSSVHGHWMLVRLLKTKPNLANAKQIEGILNQSLSAENMAAEAKYFTQYNLTNTFERTYGWAWILKLDQELTTWNDSRARKWHAAMQPLTTQILSLWKNFLPKQTYPSRGGMHPNTAFAMAFAIDWARANHDADFERQLVVKSKEFFLNEKNTPAYLEPDGSDFFSPSLEVADLMRRVLQQKEFVRWLDEFYDARSLENIEKVPVVSDLEDFMTVHLVGLSFSKAWCMEGISAALPEGHPLKNKFKDTAEKFLQNGLPLLFKGNYGGDHWLASFAVYALSEQ